MEVTMPSEKEFKSEKDYEKFLYIINLASQINKQIKSDDMTVTCAEIIVDSPIKFLANDIMIDFYFISNGHPVWGMFPSLHKREGKYSTEVGMKEIKAGAKKFRFFKEQESPIEL